MAGFCHEPEWPWLPLQRHGQGVQSLSVIFLFQAFVAHLLEALYEPESILVHWRSLKHISIHRRRVPYG